jgi:hypothetical protein
MSNTGKIIIVKLLRNVNHAKVNRCYHDSSNINEIITEAQRIANLNNYPALVCLVMGVVEPTAEPENIPHGICLRIMRTVLRL